MRKSLRRWGALVTTAFLLAFGGKAQAVIGVPDEVPASTVLFPFFKVNPTPTSTSRQDTLISITSTANPGKDSWVHVTIWSVQSKHIYDFSIKLTPHDVFSCSLLDLLINPNNQQNPCGTFQAPVGVISLLRSGDILAGYITADVVTEATALFPGQAGYPFADHNILIGHLYLVDLPTGSATGFNAVSIESEVFPDGSTYNAGIGGLGQPAVAYDDDVQVGFYLNRCIEEQGASASCAPAGFYGNRERIDGFSGNRLQTLDRTGYPPASSLGDSPLSLILRYFSQSTIGGRTEVWLWKDRVTSGTTLNVGIYDEDENVHSVSISLPDEVNFTQTSQLITPGATGGWFRIRFVCGQFGYCDYTPLNPATWGTATAPTTPIQAVAYSLQFANSQSAALRWDAVFPAHRQYTTYIGGPSAE